MNILILSWRDPKHPMSGGAEQVVHEHCKGWIKAGHKVTLFSSNSNVKKEEVLDGVHIIRKGGQLLGVQVAAFFWYLFSGHKKFDLVIDCFHGIPFFTPFYVRGKKLALIQEVAKEVWFLNHLPKPLNWMIGLVGFIIEPLLFLLYKNIPFMTGSASAKDDLIKFGIPENNITIIPHGVLINSSKRIPAKEKTKTITFLGTLARDKGIEDAIKAFSVLNREGKFNFWILGSGAPDYVSFLKTLSSNLGIETQVKFFGFVSDEEKFKRLAMSHILINPSYREGWGLVNIEANRMGTPVVAYKLPGLVDSVLDGKSGILCKKNTPENLAGNVLRVLNDSNLYNKLCRGAVAWSNTFSWEKSIVNSLGFLQKIIKTKRI